MVRVLHLCFFFFSTSLVSDPRTPNLQHSEFPPLRRELATLFTCKIPSDENEFAFVRRAEAFPLHLLPPLLISHPLPPLAVILPPILLSIYPPLSPVHCSFLPLHHHHHHLLPRWLDYAGGGRPTDCKETGTIGPLVWLGPQIVNTEGDVSVQASGDRAEAAERREADIYKYIHAEMERGETLQRGQWKREKERESVDSRWLLGKAMLCRQQLSQLLQGEI